ncbi:hypothetical protein [Streptomyces decoyicus]|uniref:Uncharacterized protein n=1 Tax=Streptomyces decoyicus TaxID=249567 RepID=A0ABZ1FDY5_9ACTN|nr:hypothetical protein [Streptomyces decoyicus]WSB68252.1 hypothetical protein OG863_09950 [Streptomyces decoyicus]
MSGHKWWHNQSLRSTQAVAAGWHLFQEVYDKTPQNSELLFRLRGERLVKSLLRAARTSHFGPFLEKANITQKTAGKILSSLPVLKKEVLRESPDGLLTQLVDAWDELRVHTSGTTGEPVMIRHDDSQLIESTAANLRLLDAYGLEPGLRILRFTADPRHDLIDFSTLPNFGNAVTMRLNVSKIQSADTSYINRVCEEFGPHVLWGQPVEVLLALLRCRDKALRLPQPKAVFTHGDTLDPAARKAIATAFDAPHHDLYGLQEFGRVAWECPSAPESYHIEEERVLITSDDASHLLISSLTNEAMSLLRYQPGDCAELISAPCPCGRNQARLKNLEGRQRGLIIDSEGRLTGVKPIRLLLENEELDRWQVRQATPGHLEVLIAPRAPAPDKRLNARLVEAIGRAVSLTKVTVRPVQLAELATPSGKAPHFRLLATQRALGETASSGDARW